MVVVTSTDVRGCQTVCSTQARCGQKSRYGPAPRAEFRRCTCDRTVGAPRDGGQTPAALPAHGSKEGSAGPGLRGWAGVDRPSGSALRYPRVTLRSERGFVDAVGSLAPGGNLDVHGHQVGGGRVGPRADLVECDARGSGDVAGHPRHFGGADDERGAVVVLLDDQVRGGGVRAGAGEPVGQRGVLGGDPRDGFLGPLGLQVADLAEQLADAFALRADLGATTTSCGRRICAPARA